jgi:hypothetical protein
MLEEKIPYSLEQVKEIANDLEFGYIVFVNIKTGQAASLLPEEHMDDVELWQETQDLIDSWEDSERIEPMSSRESYDIMVDFIETIKSENLQNKLLAAIAQRNPFRKFRDILDNLPNPEPLEKWYKFKEQYCINYTKKILSSISPTWEKAIKNI